jgi:antitoxin ParD1/3/4
MAKDTTIALGDYFDKFVEEKVAQGLYKSSSDVLRAGLRLLEEQEAKLEALRAALIEGEQSGLATPFDLEAFLPEKGRCFEAASQKNGS